MPETIALSEKSFAKLIKTYLRSTISQETLHNLTLLSIENGFVKIVDFENIFRDIAKKSLKSLSERPVHNHYVFKYTWYFKNIIKERFHNVSKFLYIKHLFFS